MKCQGMLTSAEEQMRVDFRLQDIEDSMTEAEKHEATTLTYEFQVIEPGLDRAYTFQMPADLLAKGVTFDDLLFQPVEVDARSLTARAFVRNNGAKSVSADAITFRAIAIRSLTRDELLTFNKQRSQLAKDQRDTKTAWAKHLDEVRKQHDERIAKLVGATTEATPKGK